MIGGVEKDNDDNKDDKTVHHSQTLPSNANGVNEDKATSNNDNNVNNKDIDMIGESVIVDPNSNSIIDSGSGFSNSDSRSDFNGLDSAVFDSTTMSNSLPIEIKSEADHPLFSNNMDGGSMMAQLSRKQNNRLVQSELNRDTLNNRPIQNVLKRDVSNNRIIHDGLSRDPINKKLVQTGFSKDMLKSGLLQTNSNRDILSNRLVQTDANKDKSKYLKSNHFTENRHKRNKLRRRRSFNANDVIDKPIPDVSSSDDSSDPFKIKVCR